MKTKKQYRNFQVRKEDVNIEDRTVDLSFSSEEPVSRWFGQEILDHKKTSVDMSRLNNGAPFLVNHSTDDLAGVVEKGRIDTAERKGRAKIRFGKSDRATEVMNDMADGIRPNISVGYVIKKFEITEEEGKDTVYRAVNWIPLEISSVPVPADNSVGVGRKEETQEYETEVVNVEGEQLVRSEQDEWGVRDIKGEEKPEEEKTLSKKNKNILRLKEKSLFLSKIPA